VTELEPDSSRVVLLLSCADRPGIVSAVSTAIAANGGNIVHAEQHSAGGTFFQRVVVDLPPGSTAARLDTALTSIDESFGMQRTLRSAAALQRIVVLASKQPHCLYDLLTRWRTGDLACDIRAVISNHPDHRDVSEWFGVPFHHLPVTPTTKAEQESRIVEIVEQEGVELLVMARYMQVLSQAMTDRYANRIINIHHSFLPAFAGAKPYHQAHDRGVKLIGVTAHYATEELDEGPIIEQDVVRVTHHDDVDSLIRRGRDLETVVLARALKAHLEHRIIVHGRKSVVFA
jgi:formyltetrahydrofolate deformylase